MSISLDSITISANSANVAINSPSIDLTSLQVSGFELFVEGVGLPLTIVSGGNNSLVIADGDRPASTLTARKAKIIRTKAPLQQATDAMEGARQELVTLKNSASETASNNSLARRDSSGRLKGQTAVSDNDLVPLKQLKAGAFAEVTAEDGGIGPVAPVSDGDTNAKNGFFRNEGTEGWNSGAASLGQFPYIQGNRSTSGASVGWQFGAVVSGNLGNNFPKFQGRVTSARDGDWGDIVTFFHDGNFGYLQNKSGAPVAPHQTLAGSAFFPNKSGTWRNVSSSTINNDEFGLFMVV